MKNTYKKQLTTSILVSALMVTVTLTNGWFAVPQQVVAGALQAGELSDSAEKATKQELIRLLKRVTKNQPDGHTIGKIITLKDQESYEALLPELGKHNIMLYHQEKSINMLCVYVDDRNDAWQRLQKHPSVRSVESDLKIQMEPAPVVSNPSPSPYSGGRTDSSSQAKQDGTSLSPAQIPWGVKRVGAPKVWQISKGEGVKVAVLDTGISPHPDLEIAGGVNIIDRNQSYHDDHPRSHGTMLAGIIGAIGKNGMQVGVAPGVELYAVKISDADGSATHSDLIEGLRWCLDNGIKVVNISMGGPGDSTALHDMVQQLHRQGIVIVAPAGNKGSDHGDEVGYPAGYPEVIAVAATDQRDEITSFSSRNEIIDVSAPGKDITSTNNKGGFSTEFGTSAAAPHVTGIVALLLAHNPKLTPEEVREALKRNTLSMKGFTSRDQGAGLTRISHVMFSPDIVGISTNSEREGEEIARAFDNDRETNWQSGLGQQNQFPYEVMIKYREPKIISKVSYLPRQDTETNGTITNYKLHTSKDGMTYREVALGNWTNDKAEKFITFAPVEAQYIKLEILGPDGGVGGFAGASEIKITAEAQESGEHPTLKDSTGKPVLYGQGYKMVPFGKLPSHIAPHYKDIRVRFNKKATYFGWGELSGDEVRIVDDENHVPTHYWQKNSANKVHCRYGSRVIGGDASSFTWVPVAPSSDMDASFAAQNYFAFKIANEHAFIGWENSQSYFRSMITTSKMSPTTMWRLIKV